MTTPATPPSPRPAGDDRNLVPLNELMDGSLEDWLQNFWKKYGRAVLGLFALIVIGVIAQGIWDYFAKQKDLEVQKAYAAATTPELVKTFADTHAGHPLGAIARLRMSDDAYAAGNSTEAIAGYGEAMGALPDGPLKARARLGRALAMIQGGRGTEGSAELQQLANDASQFKAIRTEATYHLISLAAEARDGAEVQQLSDQLMQIDPMSPWTQRAFELRSSLPVEAAPSAGSETPAATPGIQLNLPGR